MRREDGEIPFGYCFAVGCIRRSPHRGLIPGIAPGPDADDEIEESVADEATVATVCILRGVITDQTADQLQKLTRLLVAYNTVLQLISSELDRIDFVSAGIC